MSIVLFDKDGVIVDSEPAYMKRNKAFLKHMGYDVSDEDLKIFAGSNRRRDEKIYKEWFGEDLDVDAFMAEKWRYFNECQRVDFSKLKMPHLDETLHSLKDNGHRMSIVSSSSRSAIETLVDLYDIRDYFDYLISGDDFKEAKPNPEVYLFAMSKYKDINEKIYAVEDSTLGIQAAKNAGVITIAKKDERFNYDQSQADYFIDDLLEILDIVEKDIK